MDQIRLVLIEALRVVTQLVLLEHAHELILHAASTLLITLVLLIMGLHHLLLLLLS
mgnify:CR=1 FL=1